MKGSIRKRGKKYSVILYLGRDSNGKEKHKWFSGFNTKKEAQSFLNKALYEMENGSYILPSKILLSDYIMKWLENHRKRGLKEKTYDGYKTNIERHIIPYLGNLELQKIKPLYIDDFYNHLLTDGRVDHKGGLSTTTVTQIHRILSKALKHATITQLIQNNPCENIELPKKEKYRPTIYNENELKKLIEVAENSSIYIPILLGALLGLRRGEALGLKWKNVDFKNSIIKIIDNLVYTKDEGLKIDTPKSESAKREILISDKLVKILKNEYLNQVERSIKYQLKNENDLVCCHEDFSYINPNRFSHTFSDLLEKNNLKHIRFHDLRHSNATMMFKNNINPKIASKRLGHANIGITLDIYSHMDIEMQNTTVSMIDTLLE